MASHYHGCKNLVEIFLEKIPISFIQIGSSVEYGNTKSPQKENTICDVKSNKSTYGKAKLLASNYLMDLYKKNKFPVEQSNFLFFKHAVITMGIKRFISCLGP